VKYRPEIDGLRAVAVVPVILFHAGVPGFQGGFVGVDVFFVISGYLISSIIFGECAAGTFSIAGFYERRARRILPALFCVMAVCLPAAWLWLLPMEMKQFMQSVASVPLFASNFLFFAKTGYFDTASELKPLLHTWSLAVEEQYYVLFPLLVRVVWPLGLRTLAGCLFVCGAASLATAELTAVNHQAFAFFLLPSRLWELLIGAGVALYCFERRRPADAKANTSPWSAQWGAAFGLGLIVYAACAFDRSTPFPSLYALAPTVGTALVVLFATPATWVGRILGNRFVVGIGLVSYSAYLWHQPMFALARHRSLTEPTAELMLGLSLLSLALAYLSWRFVEAPFRNRQRIGTRQVFLFGLVGSVAFVGIGAAGHLANGFPSRFDAPTRNILAIAEHRSEPIPECDPGVTGVQHASELCDLGTGEVRRGILLGDSHGGALAEALGDALSDSGLRFKNGTWGGCPPVVNLQEASTDDPACFRYNQGILSSVRDDKEITHVLVASRWTLWLDGIGQNLDNSTHVGNGFDNGEGGVEILWRPEGASPGTDRSKSYEQKRQFARRRHVDTIQAYLDAGKKVILVYPIPEMGWRVPGYLAKHLAFEGEALSAQTGATRFDLYRSRNAEAFSILNAIPDHPNLVRIKPHEIFCDTLVKGRCVAHIDGKPLYSDDDHVSYEGAARVVALVMPHLTGI